VALSGPEVDVSVVVVAWNSAGWIGRCLASIGAGCGALTREVIVHDNASRDETAAIALAALGAERGEVIRSATNDGFAGGVNRAVARARGRFVLLLNPDCELRPGCVETLVGRLEASPKAAGAAPLLVGDDGKPQSEFQRLLPPLGATLEVPEGTGVSFAIAYDSDELVEVTGVVLDADRAAQPGLLVRAVDPVSGRTLSSATSTDDDGRFTLVMPRGASGFAFRVRGDATRQDSSALFPKITIDAGSLMPGTDGSFTLLVPASDRALRLEGRVELPATLGVNAPAAAAQVHLASPYVSDPETGLAGSLELDLTTDGEGRCVGFVLPGAYRVEIVSSHEEVGVLVDTLEVLSNPSSMILGQLFTLPERSILGGTAQLADGEPVSGSRVRASALGLDLDGETAGAARLNRSASGLTGSMGEFRLPLDVGVYDLVVEMPADSGFAWHVERDFGVGGTGVPLRRVMSIRAPYRMAGTARFAEGSPLGGARVRLLAIDAATGRAVEVGATECDEDGAFVALLPPALE